MIVNDFGRMKKEPVLADLSILMVMPRRKSICQNYLTLESNWGLPE
jgi:hypothetical protein